MFTFKKHLVDRNKVIGLLKSIKVAIFLNTFLLFSLSLPSFSSSIYSYNEEQETLQKPTENLTLEELKQKVLQKEQEQRKKVSLTILQQIIQEDKTTALNQEKTKQTYGSTCFLFNDIIIEGNTLFSARKMQKTTQKYLGQCLNVDYIYSVVAKDILLQYRQKSYFLASLEIAEESFETGKLKIIVYEKLLEKVVYNKNIINPVSVNREFANLVNKPINIKRVKQTLQSITTKGTNTRLSYSKGSNKKYAVLHILSDKVAVDEKLDISVSNDYSSTYYDKYNNTSLDIDVNYYNKKLLFTNDSYRLFTNTYIGENISSYQNLNLGFIYVVPVNYYQIKIYNNTSAYRNQASIASSSYFLSSLYSTSYLELSKTIVETKKFSFKAFTKINQDLDTNFIKALDKSIYYHTDIGFDTKYSSGAYDISTKFSYTYDPYSIEKEILTIGFKFLLQQW